MGVPLYCRLLATFLICFACGGWAQPQWSVPLHVTDGQGALTLTVGIHPNGTDGYDVGLDVFAPPPPPSGSFDARLRVPSPPEDYLTDIRGNGSGQKTWYMFYQAATGRGPIVVSWDSSALSSPMTITDNINGTLFTQSMNTTHSITPSGLLATTLRVVADISLSVSDERLPKHFELHQNYPNPFNPSTTIRYELPSSSYVRLSVLNILGEEIAALVDEVQEAGYRSVMWDAGKVASGVHFYRLTTGEFVQTKKMLLLR